MLHTLLRLKPLQNCPQQLKTWRLKILSVGAAMTLGTVAGCNFVDASVAEGGIQGTGFSLGPITQFGSIYVNGTRYNTDDADYEINGNTAASLGDDDLKQGMIVRVEGQWRRDSTGRADKVVYDDTLRGTISAITWDATTRTGEFTLLGQTVQLTGQTVFSGTTAETLANGTRVSVSAWSNTDGSFRASLVAVQTDTPPDDQLEGVISNLSEIQQTFIIGGLRVSYTSGTTLNGVTLADGKRVQVTGTFDQTESEFMADDINLDDQARFYRGKSGDDVEFTGPIESLDTTTNTLTVNGITVTWSAGDDDVFDDDLTEADLQNGLLVQIEGEWGTDGVRAEEIELREANAELEAKVESLDASAYTLKVGGVTVLVTPFTILLDDDDDQRLSRDDFFTTTTVGTWLEIDGIDRADDNGNRILEAIKIEREDDDEDDDYQLEGSITAKGTESSTDYIVVLGVRLLIPDNSVVEGGTFSSLMEGDLVEVSYTTNGTTFTATEIEVEDDDDD